MSTSIIIINWNRRNDVVRAVRSTLPAVRPGDEVFVWDNGSTDGSPAALREAFGAQPAFRLLASDRNLGVCASRNEACRRARGEVFVFMDSDSVLETADALAVIDQGFAAQPKAAALNFEIRRPDGVVLWPFARAQDAWRNREFEITRIDGCGFAARRAAFEQAGGFPEHFGYGAEEHYLARRCIGLGLEVRYFPSVAVTHHHVPSGRTPDQFATMMRNHIWMPLELFRMPWAVASAARMTVSYGRDALHERRMSDFMRGLWWTVRDFRFSRRHPMPPEAWHHFRAVIAEDRALSR